MVKYLVAGAVDFYLEDPSPQLDDEQLVAELSNSVLRYLTA